MRATLSIPSKRMEGTGTSYPASIPASVGGWDAISSVANMPPDHAVVLDNFIPRPGYLEIRRGSQLASKTVVSASTPVETVMAYNSPNTASSKLFAVGGGSIYDVSAATAAVTTVTGLSNSRCQYVNFTNSSDSTYLFVCNGADTPQVYNGSTWATAGITGATGSGINQNNFVHVNVWKGRLWFTQINSTFAVYMPVGNITGTAATFDLGSLMDRGGYLNAIGTWTVDTKQTVDEYIAFITSKGQVFVYQGTDPTTANTFALVGVYNLGSPIGRRCYLRISGNLWIITQDGVIPMTEMLAIDRSGAPRVALTFTIMNAMNQAVQNYSGNFGWQFFSYPRSTLAILNIPTAENSQSLQYVMNTITGAWCRFTNIDAQCWELWNDKPYFGSTDGKVYEWDIDSGDYTDDENYSIIGTVQTAFNYFDTRGYKKRFTAIRPIINTDSSVTPGVGLNVDFGVGAPVSTPSTVSSPGAQWDVAIWDQALWPVNNIVVANWTTVDGIGQCASIITQVETAANGNANGVTLQLNGWDITMEQGFGFY